MPRRCWRWLKRVVIERMADGQIVFEIRAENNDVLTSLNEIITKASGAGESIKETLIGAFEAVTASVSFVEIGKMLYDLGLESVNLASDLVEVQNVVDVTFGAEGAKKIESWSQQTSKMFGLTEYQAKQYSGYIGAMLKSSGITGDEIVDMSMKLTEISADLASFYNLPFDTAFEKVRSGLAGMSRPLRDLGIDLSVAAIEQAAVASGVETSYKKMDLAEKMIIRYNEIVKKSALAHGDFARTSDTYANSQKRIETGIATLKTQLGELLYPIVTEFSNALATFLETLTATPEENLFDTTAKSIAETEGQATEAMGILGYMDKLYQKYGDAATQTEEWATALDHLKTVFPEVNQFINEETGALTASNEQLREYIENSRQAAIEDAKKAALSGLSEQYVEAGQKYYTAEINRDISQGKIDQAWNSLIDYIRSKPGQENFTGENISRDEKGLEQLMYSAQSLAIEYGDNINTLENWESIILEETANVNQLNRDMDELSLDMDRLSSELDIARQALDRMAAAASVAAAASAPASTTMNSGQYYNAYYGGQITKHEMGLDSVPFTGYLASLHEGESILTAEEAKIWRGFKYGGLSSANSINYDALGVTMRENVRAGGNVFLDGEIVGRVISSQQGDSYRAMERSGFQQ